MTSNFVTMPNPMSQPAHRSDIYCSIVNHDKSLNRTSGSFPTSFVLKSTKVFFKLNYSFRSCVLSDVIYDMKFMTSSYCFQVLFQKNVDFFLKSYCLWPHCWPHFDQRWCYRSRYQGDCWINLKVVAIPWCLCTTCSDSTVSAKQAAFQHRGLVPTSWEFRH